MAKIDVQSYETEEIKPISRLPSDSLECNPINFMIRNFEGYCIDTSNIWLTVQLKVIHDFFSQSKNSL